MPWQPGEIVQKSFHLISSTIPLGGAGFRLLVYPQSMLLPVQLSKTAPFTASFCTNSSFNFKLSLILRISCRALSSSFNTSILRRSTSSKILLLCSSMACFSCIAQNERAILAFKVAISSSRPSLRRRMSLYWCPLSGRGCFSLTA